MLLYARTSSVFRRCILTSRKGCIPFRKGDNMIRMVDKTLDNYFVVQRVEVALKYGDVETNGYF